MSQEARTEAVCVLAKHCALQEHWEDLLSLGLMELAMANEPAAELCFLFGQYYEVAGGLEEAVYWYRRAALEAECHVCISYGGEAALREAIRLLRQMNRLEEAVQYEALL